MESLVIPKVTYKGVVAAGWTLDIFEMFIDKNIIEKSRRQGYKDYKYMLFGNKESGPVSLRISITKLGVTHLCSPPGNWGQMPKGFQNFWEPNTPVYLTTNVADTKIRYHIDKYN